MPDEEQSADDDEPSPTGERTSTDEETATDEQSPTDDEVVRTAAEAAEGLIFSRLSNSAVRDVDVNVSFEDGVLDVDVYLNAPDAAEEDQVAEDAALAARSAVDDLFAEAEN